MYTRSTLIFAAVLLIGSAVTAGASDIYNGGWAGSAKDTGGITDHAIEGIPVPGAIEIPETVSWYLRGDLNYGFAADVDVSGPVSGLVDPDGVFGFGVGFGRYLSPSSRLDITFDYRRYEEFFNSGRTGQLASHTALVNYYHEFDRMRGLRPYVGAGLGIALHEVEVVEANQDERIDHDVGFAVAGHAGVSLEFRSGFHLDAGYRITYQSADFTANVGGNNISFEDRLDHEIRVGLRYDIW